MRYYFLLVVMLITWNCSKPPVPEDAKLVGSSRPENGGIPRKTFLYVSGNAKRWNADVIVDEFPDAASAMSELSAALPEHGRTERFRESVYVRTESGMIILHHKTIHAIIFSLVPESGQQFRIRELPAYLQDQIRTEWQKFTADYLRQLNK